MRTERKVKVASSAQPRWSPMFRVQIDLNDLVLTVPAIHCRRRFCRRRCRFCCRRHHYVPTTSLSLRRAGGRSTCRTLRGSFGRPSGCIGATQRVQGVRHDSPLSCWRVGPAAIAVILTLVGAFGSHDVVVVVRKLGFLSHNTAKSRASGAEHDQNIRTWKKVVTGQT